MRKSRIAAFAAVILLICFGFVSVSATAFYDVPDDYWAAPYITSLESRGIVSGYGDGYFLPENNVQRCEYAKMLVNAAGISLSSARTSPYADVDVNQWYLPYINAITAQMPGYQSSTAGDSRIYFKPEDYATREDVTVALMRALNYDLAEYYPVSDSLLSDVFYDYASIPKQDRPYIAEAVKRGYITGTQEGTFEGSDPITRCEVCAVLCRAFPESGTAYIETAEPMDYGTAAESAANTETPDVIASGFSDMRVYYINVGQGDSEFIVLPNGQTMLIDAGTAESGDAVCALISGLGYSYIDYAIATHPHADHIGGMSRVLDTFGVGTMFMPNAVATTVTYERFLQKLIDKQINTVQAEAGLSIAHDGNLSVGLIAPIGSGYGDLNNYSAVARITYGSTAFLFMGDAEKEVESELLNSAYKGMLDADVLKVGHHGSSSSSAAEFLSVVSPTYAVISSGAGNSYGHPTQKTLDSLAAAGITVFRTDTEGTIGIGSNGNEVYRFDV